MDRELMHHAVLRRDDLDAFELVFRGNLALDIFSDLSLDLAQSSRYFATQILIDLDDLQPRFGYLSRRLCLRLDQAPAIAVQIGRFPFQRHHALDRNKSLLPKLAETLQLA